MNAYFYRILLPDGKTRHGILRLVAERDFSARLWLERRHDAVVLSLYRLPGWLASVQDSLASLPSAGVQRENLSGFLRDLALMVRSGIPVVDALRSLESEGDGGDQPGFAELARVLLEDLDAGTSLSDAFGRHPDIFPETVRNLVAIGDVTGSMDRMLQEAAEHVERITHIVRDARTALIYPAVVFATIVGVAFFWIYYVVPNMAQLFRQLHAKLPPITIGLVGFADWLSAHGMLVLILTAVGALALWLSLKRSVRFRRLMYRLGHRLPITRVLLRSAGMAHFTEHLALLTRSGMDIVGSLAILHRSTRDEYYKQRIDGIRGRVARGESIASSMRQVGGFPSMVVRMIAVGEESGALDSQLRYLAEEYRQRLDAVVSQLGEIIKPAVILVAGGLFMFLIAALLLPIYDLIKQVVTSPMMG